MLNIIKISLSGVACFIAPSIFNTVSNDLAHPWQIGFQDSASPGFSGIVDLHNTICFYLVLIAIGVFWLLGSVIYTYNGEKSKIVHKYLNHGTLKCLHTNYLIRRNRNIKILSFPLLGKREYSTSNENYIPGEILSSSENSDSNSDKVIPVKVYDSAYEHKITILEENKGKSGIYRFYNKINGNFYIGSSKNLSNRFRQYFNLSYISQVKNQLSISRALIKYGYDNFRLEILEYCENSKSTLLNREQYYMDLLNPVYNIEKIAGSSAGRVLSEETKLLISKSLKKRYSIHKSSQIGRKHTADTKELMSISKKGLNNPLYGKNHSEETKTLMSKLKRGTKLSYDTKKLISTTLGSETYLYKCITDKEDLNCFINTTLKTNDLSEGEAEGEVYNHFTKSKFILIEKFPSVREVGKFLDISHSTVSRYLKSGKLYQGIYKITKIPLE